MLYILIFFIVVVSFIIRTIFRFINKQKRKQLGELGEKSVHKILASLPKRKYKIIDNVLLKVNQKTTQIDHIVVSRYGVFVIETKNYKGTIIGNEYSEHWTQYLSGQAYTFYNPIKQNLAHIHGILRFTKSYEKLQVVSIVAFSKECKLQITSDTEVVKFGGLYKTIRRYRRKRISKKKMLFIYESIMDANMTTKQDHKDHVHSVKSNVKVYEKNIKRRICPRCGSKLIKRRRKHKKILRCKNKKHCGFIYYI